MREDSAWFRSLYLQTIGEVQVEPSSKGHTLHRPLVEVFFRTWALGRVMHVRTVITCVDRFFFLSLLSCCLLICVHSTDMLGERLPFPERPTANLVTTVNYKARGVAVNANDMQCQSSEIAHAASHTSFNSTYLEVSPLEQPRDVASQFGNVLSKFGNVLSQSTRKAENFTLISFTNHFPSST